MDIMNAKMYLRSTRFEFVKPVPQIGTDDVQFSRSHTATSNSHALTHNVHLTHTHNVHLVGRNHKVAILLKNRTKSKERHLMTIVDKYPHSDIIATEKDKLALVSLLESLDHPYLYPVDDFDYFVPKGQAYVIRRVAERGSLKDLIYGVKSPLHAWNDKYGRVTQGQLLGTQQCAVYGRQILDGLKALQTIGLRFPHLATSNIMMCKHGNSGELVCRISELENTFLALPPRYSSYFEPLNDRVSEEVIAFGHVLFEMATGREMRSVKPPRKDLNRLAEPLQRVLRNIFDMEQQIGSVTVDSLIEDSFFTVTMNNNALVEIVDPNPLKSIRPQHRALLDKLAEYVREHNGMSESPSEFHKSSTALMRKKQYRQEEFLARSLGSVPANSGQWLNMTGQGE